MALECSFDDTKDGEARIQKVIKEDSCEPLIVVSHKSGCAGRFVPDFTFWSYWRPKFTGVFTTLSGFALVLLGKRNFGLTAGFCI